MIRKLYPSELMHVCANHNCNQFATHDCEGNLRCNRHALLDIGCMIEELSKIAYEILTEEIK
jgi:hypothetical protein